MYFFKKIPPKDNSAIKQPEGALPSKIRLFCLLLIVLICFSVSTKLVLSEKVYDSGKAIASVSVPDETTGLFPPAVVSSSGSTQNSVKQETPGEPNVRELEGQLKKGESLDALLSRLNVPQQAREEVISSLRQCLDFRNLKPKDRISVRLDDLDQLNSCTYEVSPYEMYDVSRQDGSFLAKRREVELDRKLVRISGKVSDSLFQENRFQY
ncbi:MAG: hypothetical protein P8130_05360 [Deltaproteobacteria bacterium]